MPNTLADDAIAPASLQAPTQVLSNIAWMPNAMKSSPPTICSGNNTAVSAICPRTLRRSMVRRAAELRMLAASWAHRDGLLANVCRHLAASEHGCARADGMAQDATQ